jgi:hypothetical protein
VATVPVGRAALVVDGHPAREVGPRVGGIHHHHVVGFPRDAAREVRGFDLLGRRELVTKQPHERGLRDEVLGQRGQHETAVVAEVNLPVDLEHRPGGAEQGRVVIRPVRLIETHLLADVLLHELLAREQVVLVVLLEDLQTGRLRERLEVHARGIDERGHVLELHLGDTGRQARLAHVLHEPEVAVVDGDRDVLLDIPAHGECGGANRFRGEQEREQQRDELRGHGFVLRASRDECLAR